MNIVFVTPEMDPLIKVGGLADVVSALSIELRRRDEQVAVILPFYRKIDPKKFRAKDTGVKLTIPFDDSSHEAKIWTAEHEGVSIHLVSHKELYDREEIYGVGGTDYPDNALRFAFLAKAALETTIALGIQPDVFHINDWQTALLPVYRDLSYREHATVGRAGVVLSIHNLAYQGVFDKDYVPRLGLPWDLFHPEGLEFYGQLNILKAGLEYADLLTTVSPTYAKEIQTPDFGAGLAGLIKKRARDLTGILNGIDLSVWNPLTDAALFENYGVDKPEGKVANKRRLQERLGLQVTENVPLAASIARLDPQKGFDLVLEAAEMILSTGAQIVILGSGREDYIEQFKMLEDKYPDQLSLNEGFQAELAPKIYAASDLFLMPSRFEPCGLGQMIALRYGSIPLVRRTGGLADTIIDIDDHPLDGNGFVFNKFSSDALLATVRRAVSRYGKANDWRRLVDRAMRYDFSWKESASLYQDIYRRARQKAEERR